MLSKEEIEALSSCVGSAIGEFGASKTTDLAIEAIRKLESGLIDIPNWEQMFQEIKDLQVDVIQKLGDYHAR